MLIYDEDSYEEDATILQQSYKNHTIIQKKYNHFTTFCKLGPRFRCVRHPLNTVLTQRSHITSEQIGPSLQLQANKTLRWKYEHPKWLRLTWQHCNNLIPKKLVSSTTQSKGREIPSKLMWIRRRIPRRHFVLANYNTRRWPRDLTRWLRIQTLWDPLHKITENLLTIQTIAHFLS